MAGKKVIGKGLAKALKLKKKKAGIQKGKPLLSGVTDQSRSDAMRGLAKRSTASTTVLVCILANKMLQNKDRRCSSTHNSKKGIRQTIIDFHFKFYVR